MTEKIPFRLDQDHDGYPPVSFESLCAEPAGSAYLIDSIPFFTREAAVGDRVLASADGRGPLWFDGIEQLCGHSLIRVVLFYKPREDGIVGRLAALGCATEGMPAFNLLVVDVPEDASLAAVQACRSEQAAQVWSTMRRQSFGGSLCRQGRRQDAQRRIARCAKTQLMTVSKRSPNRSGRGLIGVFPAQVKPTAFHRINHRPLPETPCADH